MKYSSLFAAAYLAVFAFQSNQAFAQNADEPVSQCLAIAQAEPKVILAALDANPLEINGDVTITYSGHSTYRIEKNIFFSFKYKGFTSLISNKIPNLHFVASGQCFPLYLYEETKIISDEDILINQTASVNYGNANYRNKNAITDDGLNNFLAAYPDEIIKKEDIFFYVYGLLHSFDYRSRFEKNLSKELPRIPMVKTAKDFWAFSQAGRDLAKWHLDYEEAPLYKCIIELRKGRKISELTSKDYYVKKMKFPRMKDSEGKSVPDKSTIIYNAHITLKNIPLDAYDYVVNGKSAIEWVMERQGVKIDKKSEITNDANDWAIETMGNPKYPLELLQRVITVSLETNKIVNSLPKLDI